MHTKTEIWNGVLTKKLLNEIVSFLVISSNSRLFGTATKVDLSPLCSSKHKINQRT